MRSFAYKHHDLHPIKHTGGYFITPKSRVHYKMSFTWAADVSSSALSGAHWKKQHFFCPLGDIHQDKNKPESQTSPGTSVQTWVCVWGIHCCIPLPGFSLWNDFSNHWPHLETWLYEIYLRPLSEAAACVSVISSHFYKMQRGLCTLAPV